MTRTRADFAAGIFHTIIQKIERGKKLTNFHKRALAAAAAQLRLNEEAQMALVREFAGKRALEQLGGKRANGSVMFPSNIRLLPQHIITISKGTYEGLGGSNNNPVHSVTLENDCPLVVLNYDLLGQFEDDKGVREILNLVSKMRKDKRGRGGDRQRENGLVTDLSFLQALDLRRVINERIVSERLHLRIPRERIVDVLVERHGKQCEELGLAWIPTTSLYKEDGVMVDEPGAKLLLEDVKKDSDRFVFRFAPLPKYRSKHLIGDTPSNTTVLYEIALCPVD